jgi:hypothetical protein
MFILQYFFGEMNYLKLNFRKYVVISIFAKFNNSDVQLFIDFKSTKITLGTTIHYVFLS